jgi:hypothetical protein
MERVIPNPGSSTPPVGARLTSGGNMRSGTISLRKAWRASQPPRTPTTASTTTGSLTCATAPTTSWHRQAIAADRLPLRLARRLARRRSSSWWVASYTVTVDADDIETCSGSEADDAALRRLVRRPRTREFFTHVRFHKHDEDRIVVHLLVELYAQSAEEATEVLEEAARGTLAISSLAEESRPPASTRGDQH